MRAWLKHALGSFCDFGSFEKARRRSDSCWELTDDLLGTPLSIWDDQYITP